MFRHYQNTQQNGRAAESVAMWSVFSLVMVSMGLLVSLTARLLMTMTDAAARQHTGADSRHSRGPQATTPILGPAMGKPYAAPVPPEDRHSPPLGAVKSYPPR